MLGWVPKDIQERCGNRGFSVSNGECLTFEPEREPQVVEAFAGSRLSLRPSSSCVYESASHMVFLERIDKMRMRAL
jgi:hypothetical protein